MENVPLISTNENGKIIIERNESISLGDGRLFGGELLLYILGFCDYKELCKMAQVSHKFHLISDHDVLWATLCEEKGWKTAKEPTLTQPLIPIMSYNTRASQRSNIQSYPWKNLFKCKLAALLSRNENANAESNNKNGLENVEKKRARETIKTDDKNKRTKGGNTRSPVKARKTDSSDQ